MESNISAYPVSSSLQKLVCTRGNIVQANVEVDPSSKYTAGTRRVQ